MSFQNQISLAGRVSQDVNLTVKGERAILNGTIAVQKSYKDKETGEFGVDFFDFVLFSAVKDGKSYAQTMAALLKKGMYIGITGELANRPVSKTTATSLSTTCNFWNQKMPLNCVNQRKLNQLNNHPSARLHVPFFNQYTSLSCVLIKEDFHLTGQTDQRGFFAG